MALTHTQALLLAEFYTNGPAVYREISRTLPVQSARSVKRLVATLIELGYLQYRRRAYHLTLAGEAALAEHRISTLQEGVQ